MTIKTSIDTLVADAAIAHNIIHGADDETVTTDGGPVPSLAKAIADMVAYWGTLGMTLASAGTISAAPGTVGAPSLIWGGDLATGIYRIGVNNLGVAVSGAKVLDIAAAGLGVTGTLSATGTATIGGAASAYLVDGKYGQLLAGADAGGFYFASGFTSNAIPVFIGNAATTEVRQSVASGGSIASYVAGVARVKAYASSLAIAASNKLYLDGVGATGDTYLVESAANVLDLYAGGVKAASLGVGGVAVTGSVIATAALTAGGHIQSFGAGGGAKFRLTSTNYTIALEQPSDLGIMRIRRDDGATTAIADFSAAYLALGPEVALVLPSTQKLRLDGSTTGDTYLVESSANVMDFYTGGVNALRLTNSGGLTKATITGSTIGQLDLTASGVYSFITLNNSGGATKQGTILNITGDTQIRSESINFKNYDASAQYASFSATGAIISSGRLQVSADTAPPSNYGVEIGHNGTTGAILSYNRSTAAYKTLNIDGLSINLQASSATKLAVSSAGCTLSGDTVIATKTPASASATGTTGTVAWDANYLYVCTATDTWKRAALATW